MRSVHRIQQAMVRMLYDPAFATSVYAGPVDGLAESERALLCQVDGRAWSTDRYRVSRSVHALIDEFPVTAAILGVVGVEGFFASDAFATCLASRGSLALDFGAWAADAAGPIADLERAIACARRAERTAGPGVVTAPGVEPITVDSAVLGFLTATRAQLGPSPVQALAQGWKVLAPPAPTGQPNPLLLERDPSGDVGIGGASASLVALLDFARTPRDRAEVEDCARRLGCEADEATELIDDLLSDGLVVIR